MTTTPGDFGIDVLAGDITEPTLTPQELAIARAINSGGSGRGMSFYAVASRCGRKARLQDVRREDFVDGEKAGLPDTKHALVIGSIYHLFQEQWRKPRPDLELDMSMAAYNPNVIEALRMFRGFSRLWGRNYWGKPIAVECKLPRGENETAQVTKLMGHEVTGTIDMAVEMNQEDAERCQRRVPGIEPGRYLVDWKTADGESDGVALTQGLQALWYPALWNICFPAMPADGIIFDIAMKRGRRRDRAMYATDFQAVLVRTPSDAVEAAVRELRGMVKSGALNVLQDIPNRAECVDWMGKVCPFFKDACNGALRGEE